MDNPFRPSEMAQQNTTNGVTSVSLGAYDATAAAIQNDTTVVPQPGLYPSTTVPWNSAAEQQQQHFPGSVNGATVGEQHESVTHHPPFSSQPPGPMAEEPEQEEDDDDQGREEDIDVDEEDMSEQDAEED